MLDFFKRYTERGFNIFYEDCSDIETHEIQCGYCGRIVAPHIGYSIKLSDRNGSNLAFIYKCPHCSNPTIYYVNSKISVPGNMFGREIKNLPDNIQTLYSECRTCYSNQCYTASQMIARTLLMHIAVEQGAEANQSFVDYVNYLDFNRFIPPNGKAWVDFIRRSGNVANHDIIIKEKEETEKVILFLSALLLFIYELPNELQNME